MNTLYAFSVLRLLTTQVALWLLSPSLSPLALSPLFISGSIRNTPCSKGKHKRTVPSLTAPSPRPSKRVYVGWIDSISPLHRLHRAAPHFTNKEKTRIGNVHFEPLHRPLICLYLEERHHTIPPSLFRRII